MRGVMGMFCLCLFYLSFYVSGHPALNSYQGGDYTEDNFPTYYIDPLDDGDYNDTGLDSTFWNDRNTRGSGYDIIEFEPDTSSVQSPPNNEADEEYVNNDQGEPQTKLREHTSSEQEMQDTDVTTGDKPISRLAKFENDPDGYKYIQLLLHMESKFEELEIQTLTKMRKDFESACDAKMSPIEEELSELREDVRKLSNKVSVLSDRQEHQSNSDPEIIQEIRELKMLDDVSTMVNPQTLKKKMYRALTRLKFSDAETKEEVASLAGQLETVKAKVESIDSRISVLGQEEISLGNQVPGVAASEKEAEEDAPILRTSSVAMKEDLTARSPFQPRDDDTHSRHSDSPPDLKGTGSVLDDTPSRHRGSAQDVKGMRSAMETLRSKFYMSPEYKGHRYYLPKVQGQARNVRKAMRQCRILGGQNLGYLAEINDFEERNFVANWLRHISYVIMPTEIDGVFISGSDAAVEGRWVNPRSNEPLRYTDWDLDLNQPDNRDRGEDCVLMDKNRFGKWHDYPCRGWDGNYAYFLCEAPIESE